MGDYTVMVALNGARRGKQDHAALPMTVAEIVSEAALCQSAGARALHLHVRDEQGRHSLDPGRYRDALNALAKTVPQMAVQITTESAGIYSPADQMRCLEELKPAWASVSVREMAADPAVAQRTYALCDATGTRVQHILYGAPCIRQLKGWYNDGTVPSHMRDAIFVLGQYAPPVLAEPGDLAAILEQTADLGLNWSVCAFGCNECACLLEAIATGGDVRIGFENNIEGPDGALLESNAASVAALVKAAQAAGHRLKEC